MIYNVENTVALGNVCRVWDATGKEVERCISANTETGEVVVQLVRRGKLVMKGGKVRTRRRKLPAPLRAELTPIKDLKITPKRE